MTSDFLFWFFQVRFWTSFTESHSGARTGCDCLIFWVFWREHQRQVAAYLSCIFPCGSFILLQFFVSRRQVSPAAPRNDLRRIFHCETWKTSFKNLIICFISALKKVLFYGDYPCGKFSWLMASCLSLLPSSFWESVHPTSKYPPECLETMSLWKNPTLDIGVSIQREWKDFTGILFKHGGSEAWWEERKDGEDRHSLLDTGSQEITVFGTLPHPFLPPSPLPAAQNTSLFLEMIAIKTLWHAELPSAHSALTKKYEHSVHPFIFLIDFIFSVHF